MAADSTISARQQQYAEKHQYMYRDKKQTRLADRSSHFVITSDSHFPIAGIALLCREPARRILVRDRDRVPKFLRNEAKMLTRYGRRRRVTHSRFVHSPQPMHLSALLGAALIRPKRQIWRGQSNTVRTHAHKPAKPRQGRRNPLLRAAKPIGRGCNHVVRALKGVSALPWLRCDDLGTQFALPEGQSVRVRQGRDRSLTEPAGWPLQGGSQQQPDHTNEREQRQGRGGPAGPEAAVVATSACSGCRLGWPAGTSPEAVGAEEAR